VRCGVQGMNREMVDFATGIYLPLNRKVI